MVKVIKDYFEKKAKRKEKLFQITREIIKECGLSIKSTHSRNTDKAKKHLNKALELMKKAKEIRECPSETLVAEQELVEAKIVLWAFEKNKAPEISESKEAYVLGSLDAVGELKRMMLNCLINNEVEKARAIFKLMEKIYDEFSVLVFPDYVLPAFRRKLDIARMQVERARELLVEGCKYGKR